MYHDIVPSKRIVYTSTLFAEGHLTTVSLTTLQFDTAGHGTQLVLTDRAPSLTARNHPSGGKRAPATGWTRWPRSWSGLQRTPELRQPPKRTELPVSSPPHRKEHSHVRDQGSLRGSGQLQVDHLLGEGLGVGDRLEPTATGPRFGGD